MSQLPLLQIELQATAAALPRIEAALEATGALAVSLADPGGEPVLEPAPGETPLWTHVIVSALFTADTDADALCARLAKAMALPREAIQSALLPPRDWIREFRETLKPMRYGTRLWICPDETPCPDPAGIALRLEPGLAFGSGSHATTALCLDWLTTLPLNGRRVLDWGCGSGVLSIAALALGARQVTALDIDQQALLATSENARRNSLDGALRVLHPEHMEAAGPYDVLVANILANSLISLAPTFREHCLAGAAVAMSGILVSQAAQVRAACARQFDLEITAERDGWSLLAGTAI